MAATCRLAVHTSTAGGAGDDTRVRRGCAARGGRVGGRHATRRGAGGATVNYRAVSGVQAGRGGRTRGAGCTSAV
jgi:hypothetical protein